MRRSRAGVELPIGAGPSELDADAEDFERAVEIAPDTTGRDSG